MDSVYSIARNSSRSLKSAVAGNRLRLFLVALGLYPLLGGLISLLGWILDVPALTDWNNTGVSIQPNAAVAALAAGAAVLLLTFGYRIVPIFLAVIVAFIGISTVFQIVTDINFGFNTWLMFGRPWGRQGVISPGRMGTPAAISWTLIGIAVFLTAIYKGRTGSSFYKRANLIGSILALIPAGLSLLSIVGFLYAASPLYSLPLYTVIALQTASFIFVVSLAVVANIPDAGPMRFALKQNAAGLMFRRILPVIILVPLVLGFLRLTGDQAGWYDPAFGAAIRTISEILVFLLILAWTVTAVQRASEHAEEQERALLQLADSMPQLVWIADDNGDITYFNDRASAFDGIGNGDDPFRWRSGVHPEDLPSTLAEWDDAVRNERVYEHKHRILMADGSYRWQLSRAVPRIASNGKVTRWYGTTTDIHDITKAEESLRESEQRFVRFMHHLPGLAWIKDASGRYVYANKAATKAFGVSSEIELYGKTDDQIFPPENAKNYAENDRRALRNEGGLQVIETLIDATGEKRESLVNKFPIPAHGDERSLIGGMAIDITEQRRAVEDQAFLLRITEIIRVSRNADQLVEKISAAVGKYLGVHRCLFNEIDQGADTEIVQGDFSRGGTSIAGTYRISEYSSITTDIMRSGKTVVNHDSSRDTRTMEWFDEVYKPNHELAYVAVPMLRNSEWVASLWCSENKPRHWADREVALLENIAERTWAAVERLRAEKRLVQAAEIDAFRIELGDALAALKDPLEMEKQACILLGGILQADRVVYANVDSGDLVITNSFSNGVPPISRPMRLAEFSNDLLERCRRGESIVIDDVRTTTGSSTGQLNGFKHAEIASLVLVPMMKDEASVAALGVLNSARRRWTKVEVDLIREVAGRVWSAKERVLNDAALRESETRLKLAQEAGNVGVWDWDILRGRTYWSDQMWRLYDEDPPTDANPNADFWNSHLHPEDRLRAFETFRETLESDSDHHSDTFRIVLRNGSIRWIESIAKIERDESGSPVRMYGVNLDITEQKATRDELESRVAERVEDLANANAMLVKQMQERAQIEEQRIDLLKRLFTLQEDERSRIARDIHDHMGQRLTALRLKIAAVRELCEDGSLVAERVDRLQVISEMLDKEVSFMAWELRPEILDTTDFVHAIDQYVREWSRHSDIFAEFDVIGLKNIRLGKDVENNLYRITQEALNNAAKYASATKINVILEQKDHQLVLIIEDDGVGFDVAAAGGEKGERKGFGLTGMQERALLIGGTVEIESSKGAGTTVYVRVPLQQNE